MASEQKRNLVFVHGLLAQLRCHAAAKHVRVLACRVLSAVLLVVWASQWNTAQARHGEPAEPGGGQPGRFEVVHPTATPSGRPATQRRFESLQPHLPYLLNLMKVGQETGPDIHRRHPIDGRCAEESGSPAELADDDSRMEYSPIFKGLIVLFLSSFAPVTLLSFIWVRRTKKAVEFARVVHMLDIAEDVVEFARNQVAEQYAARDFRMPVLFAWLISILGFVSLLFGADMVGEHEGKANFLLTGISTGDAKTLQALRVQSMAVMSLAFIGAFIWSAQNVLHRLNAGDLAPSTYFNAGIRMILAPILSLMIAHLVEGVNALDALHPGLPVIAFLVGWFPNRALIFLKEQFPLIFRNQRSAHALPLNMIEGIHTHDRARLEELGIGDAQNLANANFIELVVRTAFNPGQIIDWIGQARLYVYFKNDVVVLRKHQIRTVFDMLYACGDLDFVEKLAGETGLNALGLQTYLKRLSADPTLEQLMLFQKRLCCTMGADDLTVEEMESMETGHGDQARSSGEQDASDA